MPLLPWTPHTHEPSPQPDEDGDTLCVVCGEVLSGPGKDEADAILRLFSKQPKR